MKRTKRENTTIICKNCNNSFEGNYCNNCGQSSKTERINFLLYKHDNNQGISRIDTGIVYTLKQLFTRPGHSVREYIDGKRVKHYKPVSLVILLATAYGILFYFFKVDFFDNSISEPGLNIVSVNKWTTNHYSWITLATIPFYTVGTYVCFGRQGYNISELLILNFFKAAQRLSISIAAFPLIWYFSKTSFRITVADLIFLAAIIFTIWTDIQFFNRLSKVRAAILSLLSQIVFLLIFVLILSIVLLFLNR